LSPRFLVLFSNRLSIPVGSLPVIRRRIFDIVLAEGESFGPRGLSFVGYRRFGYGCTASSRAVM
jgi:hypothetical protein